jgi:hypothetical protein
VQPLLAIPPELTDGLAVVGLDGSGIPVEWHAVYRPDAASEVLDLITTIQQLRR